MAQRTIAIQVAGRVFEANPTTNYGASLFLGNDKNSKGYRILLAIDLTEIPPDASIIAADTKLRLYCSGVSTGGKAGTMYRATASWGEYAVTWNTQPGTSTPSMTFTTPTGTGWWEMSGANFKTIVEDALQNRDGQLLLLLKVDSEAAPQNYVEFEDEDALGSNTPEVVITYEVPASPIYNFEIGDYSLPNHAGSRCVFETSYGSYAVVMDDNGDSLRMFKMKRASLADNAYSMVEQNTANRPNPTDTIKAFTACLTGATIYVVYVCDDGTNADLYYCTFATDADTWGTPSLYDTQIKPDDDVWAVAAEYKIPLYVVYRCKPAGSNVLYEAVTAQSLGDGLSPSMAQESGGRIAVVWSTAANYKARSYLSPAGWDTEQTIYTGAPAQQAISIGVINTDAWHARLVDADGKIRRYTRPTGASQTWSLGGTDGTAGHRHPSVSVRGAQAYAVIEDVDDNLAWYRDEAGYDAEKRQPNLTSIIDDFTTPFASTPASKTHFESVYQHSDGKAYFRRVFMGLTEFECSLRALTGPPGLLTRIDAWDLQLRTWEPKIEWFVSPSAYQNPHMTLWARGYLWASTRRPYGGPDEPAKLLRIDPSDGSVTALEFADDDDHEDADSMVYCPVTDRIYLMFKSSDPLTISKVDPLGDPLSYSDLTFSGYVSGPSNGMCVVGKYLYLADDAAKDRILKIDLETETIVDTEYLDDDVGADLAGTAHWHSMEYDPAGGYIYAFTSYGAGSGNDRAVKVNPTTLAFTYIKYTQHHGFGDSFCFYGDYIWHGGEVEANSQILKINKSDLAIAVAIDSPTEWEIYGCFVIGSEIWITLNQSACILRYDPTTNRYLGRIRQTSMDTCDIVPIWESPATTMPSTATNPGDCDGSSICISGWADPANFTRLDEVFGGEVVEPPSGVRRSIWVPLQPCSYAASGKDFDSIIVFSDSESNLGAYTSIKAGRAINYVRPKFDAEGWPKQLTIANYGSDLKQTPYDLFTLTPGLPLYLDGSISGGSPKNGNEGGNYIVIQAEIEPGVGAGESLLEGLHMVGAMGE